MFQTRSGISEKFEVGRLGKVLQVFEVGDESRGAEERAGGEGR